VGAEVLRCDGCGALIPFGPANDTYLGAWIEIRAAELADIDHSFATERERVGWNDLHDTWSCAAPDDDEYVAGQLAFEIWSTP
jgi:hypothetical protein